MLAYALWALACVLAVLLAGGALLIALKVDESSAPWSWWISGVDLVTPGWFQRPDQGAVGAVDVRPVVLRWGSGALAFLALGSAAQWVVRPR